MMMKFSKILILKRATFKKDIPKREVSSSLDLTQADFQALKYGIRWRFNQGFGGGSYNIANFHFSNKIEFNFT